MSTQADIFAARLSERGFNGKEIENIYTKSLLWGSVISVGTAVIIASIYFVLTLVNDIVNEKFNQLSADIILVGIVCIVILVFVVYIAIIRGKLSGKMSQASESNASKGISNIQNGLFNERDLFPISSAQNPWICPHCGSLSTRQYQVSITKAVNEGNQFYEWESQCYSCGETWRWRKIEQEL